MKRQEKLIKAKEQSGEQAGYSYLSEKELADLMAEVEKQDLVKAPGDLLTGILQKVEHREGTENAKEGRDNHPGETVRVGHADHLNKDNRKILEFRGYCIRVITSVVAAIALLFLFPGFSNAQREEMITKQSMVLEQEVKSRQEVLNQESLMEKIGDCRLIRDGDFFDIIKNLGGK